MSNVIDQRVVEMRFDNQHFEKNVSTTMSTLDKLRQSLDLKGATKGLENIDATAKRINLSGLVSAVDNIHQKFSAMEVMAVTALANITNSAVNAGKRIVSALTVDPIKTGLQEYETQINAVQTILANTSTKGTTIDDVNKALDELNTYADKTIYNFTQMTRNIGTFTAAGVDLDTSVSAIQGIANLAAVSGSTSQQASTAMYQLSQALASGTVKLQDWNSVVNAGMGGQVFQDALKRTAKVMGTDVDALIAKYGSFRESLSQGGWLTTDVLTETLNQFTMAAKEGSKEWEAYKKSLKEKGYTEEQAIEILKMANTATDAATKVKTFTQLWDTLKESAQSGWTQSWEIIIGNFEEAKETLSKVSDVIGAMIGASADARNSMLQDWKDLGGRTAIIESISNAFDGIINIITPIKEAFREIFPPITGQQLFAFSEGVKGLTEQFKTFTEEHADDIKNTFKGIFSVLGLVRDAVFGVIGAIKPLTEVAGNLVKGIVEICGSFGEYLIGLTKSVDESGFLASALDTLSGAIRSVVDWFKPLGSLAEFTGKMFDGLGWIAGSLINIFKQFGSAVKETFGITNDFNFKSIIDLFSSGVFAGMVVTLKKLVDGVKDAGEPIANFFKSFEDIKKNVSNVINGVTDSFKALQTKLKADTLFKIATAIAVLAASLAVLAMINEDRLTSALTGITFIFVELMGSMYALSKIAEAMDKKTVKNLKKMVGPMIGLSVAVLILATAMKKMSDLNWDELVRGLIGIAGTAGVMVIAMGELSKHENKIKTTAVNLIAFAIGINLLAEAVKKLGSIDPNNMIQGLLSVAGVLAGLAVFSKYVDSSKFGLSSGTGILVMAAGINLLAIAVKQFAGMDDYAIVQGLLAVGGILAEVALFSNMTKNTKNVVSTSIGLTILAGAMKIFASVIGDFGSMNWKSLLQGLAGMASALAIVGLAAHAMKGTIAGSGSMLIMASALAILTPQLLLLSTMNGNEIGMGLLALAGAFAVLGAAGYVLAPLTPALLGLSGAIALLGVGILAIGGGLLAFSAGLSALSVSGVAGAGALAAIITTIAGIIPLILVQLANGIVAFCEVIGRGAKAIADAVTAVVLAVIDVIIKAGVPLAQGVLELLTGLFNVLTEFLPKLVDAGVKMVLAVLEGIAKNTVEIVQKGIEIVVNFIDGVASMLGAVIDSGINLIVEFINGLAEGIRNNGPAFVDAVWNLFTAVIETALYVLTSSISETVELGGKIMNGLKEGISSMISPVIEAVSNIIDNAIEAIKGYIKDFTNVGGSIIEGLVNGISNGFSSVVSAATNVVSGGWEAAKKFLGINSPSRKFAELGKFSDLGFAQGLDKYSKVVSKSAENVGDGALKTLTNSLATINLDMLDEQPTIRPVLDMSDVESGINNMNSLFANTNGLTVGASLNTSSIGKNTGAVASIMSNNQNGSDGEVINAIKDLKNTLRKASGDTYNFNGITYSEGSEINNAVQTIVRAAKMEGRR